MKEREELELILKLIGKYNLPLSPILEYAVKEKMEEFPEADNIENENKKEPNTDYHSNVADAEHIIPIPQGEQRSSIRGYSIKNQGNHCYIINNNGERVFSSSGKLIILGEEFYRVCFTYSFISMNLIKNNERGEYYLGKRILNAQHRSPLYASLDEKGYLEQIKAIRIDHNTEEYHVQVGNRWYGSSGFYADFEDEKDVEGKNSPKPTDLDAGEEIRDYVEDSKLNGIEVEHVFLDTCGKVINSITTSSVKLENDTSTDNRKGKRWTEDEEKLIARYFQQGVDIEKIAENFGRTEVAVKIRLAKLGLIDYTYGQDDDSSNQVESKEDRRIGYTVRLFPSQLIGEIIRVRKTSIGIKKLVVKTKDSIVEIDDLPYLYEVLKR